MRWGRAQPRRLREAIDPGSPLGLGLQQAAARRPSTAQVRAMDQQLFGAAGVLGVVAVGSSAVAAPLAVSAAASASPAAMATVASGASVLSLKVGLVLAVAVSGAVGGTVAWREHRRPPTAPVVARTVPGRVLRSAAPLKEPAPKAAPQEAPAPAPAAALAAPTPAPPATARPKSRYTARARDDSAAAPSRPDPVAAEIALIDEARASSDPTRALQLCRDHERRFARGILREEREVVAISALISLRRFSEARDRGARFLQSYPVSAYAASVRDHLREIERR